MDSERAGGSLMTEQAGKETMTEHEDDDRAEGRRTMQGDEDRGSRSGL